MAQYPAALAASSSSSSSPTRPSSSSSPTKTRASSRRRRNDDLLAHFPFRSRRNKRLANDAAALLAAKRQSVRLSRANLINSAAVSNDGQSQKTLPPIPPLGRRRNFFKAMQRKRSQPTSGGASPPQSSSASTSPSSPSSSKSSNSLASSSSITSTATSLATSASASSSCPLSDRARGVVEAVRVAAPSSATSKLKELNDSKPRSTTNHASTPSQDGSATGDDSEDSLQRRNRREAAAQNLQRWPWAGDDTFGAEASNPLHKLDPSSPARPSSPEPYGAIIAPLITPPPMQQPPSPVTVYEIASTPPMAQGGLFAPAHDEGQHHSHWSVSTLGPANRSVLLPSPRIDRPLWLPPPPPGDALKPRRKAVPQAQPPPPPRQAQKTQRQRQRYQQQQQRSSASTHVTGLGYLGAPPLSASHGVGSSSVVEEGSCINFEWTSVTDRDEVTMSSSVDSDSDAQSEGGDGLGLDPAIFDSTGTEYGDVVQQSRGAPWHAVKHEHEQRGHWRSRSSIDCDGFGGHHLRTSDLDILSKFEMVSTAAPPPRAQPAFAPPAHSQPFDRPSYNEPPPAFEPQIQVSFEAVPPGQCAETMAPSSAIAWTVTVTHNGEEKVVRGQASLESLLPLLPAAQPLPAQAQRQQQYQQQQQPTTPVLLLSPVMEDTSSSGAFSRERTLSHGSSTCSSAFTSREGRVRYNSESTDATGTSAATTASSSNGPRFKPRPFMLSGAGTGGEERCSRLLGEELQERAQRKASLIMARRASSRLTVANVTPATSAAPSPSPTSSSTLSIPDRSASLAHQAQHLSTRASAATIRASSLLLRSQYASLASSTTPMPRYYGKRPSFAPPVVLGSSSYARERARPYPAAAGCQKLQQPFLLSASASAGGSNRASGVASWRASTYRVAGEGVERRVCYDVRRHRLELGAAGGLSRGRYVPTSSALCI